MRPKVRPWLIGFILLIGLLCYGRVKGQAVEIRTDSVKISVDSSGLAYPLIMAGGRVKYKITQVSLPPAEGKKDMLWVLIPVAFFIGFIAGKQD